MNTREKQAAAFRRGMRLLLGKQVHAVTLARAAKDLGITPKRLSELIRVGAIGTVRVAGHRLVPVSELRRPPA